MTTPTIAQILVPDTARSGVPTYNTTDQQRLIESSLFCKQTRMVAVTVHPLPRPRSMEQTPSIDIAWFSGLPIRRTSYHHQLRWYIE